MAYSLLSLTHEGVGDWRFEFDGTEPFRLVRDGITIDNAYAGKVFILRGTVDDPPPLEILDATESSQETESEKQPPYMCLQWNPSPNASYYRIDVFIGVDWYEFDQVVEDAFTQYYKYNTPKQQSFALKKWRVVAVDASGSEAHPVQFTALLFRNSDPPEVDVVYQETPLAVKVQART